MARYQTGDAAGAVRAFRSLLDENPEDARTLNDPAWILQGHDGRYDEALANNVRDIAPAERSEIETIEDTGE